MTEYTFGIFAGALNGKENYVVRLPNPHLFSELYKTIQPFCKPTTAVKAEREGIESRSFEEARTEQLQPQEAY